MKEIFKQSFKSVLASKSSVYMFLFGCFYILLVHSLGFSIKIETGGNYLDLTPYKLLFSLHIFLYLFYASVLVNLSGQLQEEIKEGITEQLLVYLSREEYFLSKIFSYIVSSTFLLLLIAAVGGIASFLLTKQSISWKFFMGFLLISINLSLLICVFLLLSLLSSPKGSGFLSFLLYVIVSFLNSKSILTALIGSEGIAREMCSIFPSVFRIQNEFLSFAVGLGFSRKLLPSLANLLLYSLAIKLLLLWRIKRYECKQ